MRAGSLTERWQATLDEIADAARAAGRSPADVRLVAVSKLHPAEDVAALHGVGQMLFGENYVQEALAKMESLSASIVWHFIGHLQTNKIRHVAGRFALIHGLDSLRLAHALQDRSAAMDVVQEVLVQVNLANEAQKSGISVDQLPDLADFLVSAHNLRWTGLMLMPPVFDDPEGARPYFSGLRELRDQLETRHGVLLPELSMGMTGDFVAAIEEGATLVRIGTKIFGERD